MAYPNVAFWSALRTGRCTITADCSYVLSLVECGSLVVPTGRLVACDPFCFLEQEGNPFIIIPPGRYRVVVTLADVSDSSDGSHFREAYATLIIDEAATEVTRRIITPLPDGKLCPPEMTIEGDYHGFPVGAGTACFIDGGAVATAMPDCDWYDELFDNGSSESWFARVDDPAHIQAGIANIPLPLGKEGENIVIIHSGWGDGSYPIVGGYDATDRLVNVHIDFMVVYPEST